MPSLSLLHGTSVSRRFPLSGTETSIGRSLEADISIDDPLLRDTHALVRCDGSHFIVSPATLDALVSVNGQRVRRATLAQGDRIELGDSVLIFHLLEAFDERRPLLTADDAVAGARLLVDYAQHLLEDHDIEHMLSQLLDAAITLARLLDPHFFHLLSRPSHSSLSLARQCARAGAADPERGDPWRRGGDRDGRPGPVRGDAAAAPAARHSAGSPRAALRARGRRSVRR